MIRFKQI